MNTAAFLSAAAEAAVLLDLAFPTQLLSSQPPCAVRSLIFTEFFPTLITEAKHPTPEPHHLSWPSPPNEISSLLINSLP